MPSRKRKNVGLIGLGIIGQRVAASLRRNGYHVFVWNRTPRPVQNFLGSPVEVAELCEVIQIFVADDTALSEILDQITPALSAHHIIVAHCTISPESMRAAAQQVQRRGARFLDAPFTGSKLAAEKGELIYYVAGDDGALQQARRILEASSKTIVELGEIGEATTIKIASNMVTAAIVQSAAEALALVTKSGISPEKLELAMRNNGSNSATLTMKLPMMIEGNYETHFSVKHMLKDVQLAAKIARSLDVGVPVAETTEDALLDEMKRGGENEDYSAVARRYFPDGKSLRPERPSPVSPPKVEEVAVPAPTISDATSAAATEPEATATAITEENAHADPESETTLSATQEATPETGVAAVEASPDESPADQPEQPSKTEAKPGKEGAPPSGIFRRLFRRGADY